MNNLTKQKVLKTLRFMKNNNDYEIFILEKVNKQEYENYQIGLSKDKIKNNTGPNSSHLEAVS